MCDFSISLSNLSYEIVNFCQAKSFSFFMLFTLLKMITYDVEIYLSHAMLKAPFFGFWDIHVVVVKVMVAIAVFLIEFVPIVAVAIVVVAIVVIVIVIAPIVVERIAVDPIVVVPIRVDAIVVVPIVHSRLGSFAGLYTIVLIV